MKPTVDTRTFLAIMWSGIAGFVLIYIVIVHGDDKALLNLIIGLVGGIITGIVGTYFSMNIHKEPNAPVAPSASEVKADVSITATTVDNEHKEEGS